MLINRIFLFLIALCIASTSYAAQKTVTVGTSGSKASLDTNFGNIQDNFTELYGNVDQSVKTTSNPVFNSINLSSGNIAANNTQVVKQWITGLSYTADISAVVYGGDIYVCTSTHTAGSTTEPGVGANWGDVWKFWGADIYQATMTAASQAEMEAGTETAIRSMSPLRVKQAIDALAGEGSMTYPGAGIPLSTGSAWGTSYSLTSLAAALDGEAWTFTGAVDLSGASSVTMGPLSFEGATVDAYKTTFSITDPTANRDINVLNMDSTIPAASSVDANGKILSAGLADTPSANGVSLFTAANYAAMRTLLDLESGTDFNAYDADIADLADGHLTGSKVDGYAVKTNSKATTYTIGTDDASEAFGGTIYVTSATTITAPAIAVGQNFCVVTIGDIAVSLDVNASDQMILDGVTLADGDKATNSSKAGDTICCQYYSADGQYCWSGTVLGGHWTDGN